jgi:hypothetical protein
LGYSLEVKNGQYLPVLTTTVHSIQSGQGFQSYLALSSSNSASFFSSFSINLHSGYQLHPANFQAFEYLYSNFSQHSGQFLQTSSITFSAFSQAFSKSFFKVFSQNSFNIFLQVFFHSAILSKSSSTFLVNLYSIISGKYFSKNSVTINAVSVGFKYLLSNFST